MPEEADYTINAKPTNGKTWREANDIEVVLSLELENKKKTFKGVISLLGIAKKVG